MYGLRRDEHYHYEHSALSSDVNMESIGVEEEFYNQGYITTLFFIHLTVSN